MPTTRNGRTSSPILSPLPTSDLCPSGVPLLRGQHEPGIHTPGVHGYGARPPQDRGGSGRGAGSPHDGDCSEDFPPDNDTRSQIRSLNAQGYLGTQYEWLAHAVKQYDLHGIELSVHVDDKAARFLEGQVRPVQDGTPRGSWELNEEALDTPLALFRHFRFPLLPLTKLEMEQVTRDHGFVDILADTWFCHSRFPTPCGMCPPCRYALVEGMEHRIPRIRRSWPYRLGWKAAKTAQSLVRKVT
jgi:hypothetical protein